MEFLLTYLFWVLMAVAFALPAVVLFAAVGMAICWPIAQVRKLFGLEP